MNRSYRRTVLTACVLAYFGTRITQLVVSPLVPAITVAFDVSAGAIGFALTAMWAGYALVQLPSSLFGDRFGERPVILLALGLTVAASLALALAQTYPIFLTVIAVLGMGVGLYYDAGTALLAREFDELGRAVGVHRTGGQIAGFVAPPFAAAAGGRFGWRSAILLSALVPIVVFALVADRVRASDPVRRELPLRNRLSPTTLYAVVGRSNVAFVMSLATLGEFVNVATISFLPVFLVEVHDQSIGTASLLFSMYFVVVTATHPLTGWLSDARSRPAAAALIVTAGVVGYAALVTAPALGFVVVGLFLVGFATTWSTAVQSLLLDLLDTEERGLGFGTVRTVYVLLGSLGSAVTGVVADFGGWELAFGSLGFVLVLVLCALLAGTRMGEIGR